MATSRNDITGAKLQTRPANNTYRAGWEAVFGNKDVVEEVVATETEATEAQTDTEE